MKPVIVTTTHRGVFCGLMDSANEDQSITLQRCRMAIGFKGSGVVGLSQGPTGRVSGMSPSANIKDVTAVFDVSEEGWKEWDAVDVKSGKG